VVHVVQDEQLVADLMEQAILSSNHQNCPVSLALLPGGVPC